jgi:hypothetical protein
MSSIRRDGWTYRGISVESRGVFTDKYGKTYAGQCKDGYACGLGVTTWSNGSKTYAEHGPDGQFDGRYLDRFADGHTFYYSLYERGEQKEVAVVSADGRCYYNGRDCTPDDPRVLALIAQVAPVEVRPAARAPHPPSAATQTPRNRPMDQPARFAPPQALAKTVATEVYSHAARRRWWPCDTDQQQPHSIARPRSDACADHCGLTGGTPRTP